MAMTSAVQLKPINSNAPPGEKTTRLSVTLLPTLPIHAGASMSLYTSDLLKALDGIPGVAAEAHWPAFGSGLPANRLRSRWIRYVKYVKWCRTLAGDVFHITDHGNAQLLLGLPAAKTVVTCHDLYPLAVVLGCVKFPGAERRRKMLPTALRLSLLRKAAAIIVISQHTLRECRDCLGIRKDRLFLAYYGISDSFRTGISAESRESIRSRLGIRPEQIALLHVGSNDPRKNLNTVLRVMGLLRKRYEKDVCLIKVGSKFGPREKEIARRLSLSEAIRDLGALSAEQTARAYRACDVLLYPSFHEGFCRPVTEAMASGTPVVTSNRGAIPEVVQDPRLLFDPKDVEGMADRIVQITDSDELREEIVQLGKVAAQRFTWEAHGAAVAEAYQAVVTRWV